MEYKTIAFDVMGSDKGIPPALEAACQVLNEFNDLKIIFVGNQEEIKKYLKKLKYDNDRVEFFNTTEIINMTDSILDFRRKKDSSMTKAIELVNEDKANAVVTGGATAPYIAACHFIIKEIQGVDRPAFMPVIPTIVSNKVTLLLDVGANLECTPKDLKTFAIMAGEYSKLINKIEKPLIGLLNVGEEKSKGLELHRETYKLLEDSERINFFGNIEPRYVTSGFVDVVVTDGYTGNIALKAAEGMAKNLLNEIKSSVTKNLFRKLAALRLRKAFKEVAAKFDYKNHAGALLIGLNKIAFKSHGSSDKRSFYATLKMTYNAIVNNVVIRLKEALLNE
ncbi:phosphate acyltransferase PlsX [Spiroplasma turonicum]|uniref:Phosphate acyltransferase n=1 Tax=Spiroplasma turonicum TaxID=216946 RepID=A0A0K1P543_9MOLU|nr:phosphate acyltransferase PlsX [Spiroplasma turonicum]AKU79436.1 glycerol-3-phosphate acyltransferase PlsX [Spiroplasma turonicum]ALX70458.1 glycerol-3-phosphate acyltransferase PlsX [Spiroplasma turonicum]